MAGSRAHADLLGCSVAQRRETLGSPMLTSVPRPVAVAVRGSAHLGAIHLHVGRRSVSTPRRITTEPADGSAPFFVWSPRSQAS